MDLRKSGIVAMRWQPEPLEVARGPVAVLIRLSFAGLPEVEQERLAASVVPVAGGEGDVAEPVARFQRRSRSSSTFDAAGIAEQDDEPSLELAGPNFDGGRFRRTRHGRVFADFARQSPREEVRGSPRQFVDRCQAKTRALLTLILRALRLKFPNCVAMVHHNTVSAQKYFDQLFLRRRSRTNGATAEQTTFSYELAWDERQRLFLHWFSFLQGLGFAEPAEWTRPSDGLRVQWARGLVKAHANVNVDKVFPPMLLEIGDPFG